MVRYEQMLAVGASSPLAFTQTDLSGSARMAAGLQVQQQTGSGAFEVVLEQWIPRTDGVAPDRAQTDIFTAASPYRMALSAPGLVTDWTSDSELAKPHALDGRQPGRYAGHEQRVGGPHRVQFGSPTSTRKPSSEPRTAVSTRRARRTQAFALKFPST